jgi:hypothetical protein
MYVHGVSARHRGVWAEDVIPLKLLGNKKNSLVEGVNYGYINAVKTQEVGREKLIVLLSCQRVIHLHKLLCIPVKYH